MATQEIDVSDVVEGICGLLKKFAINHGNRVEKALPRRNRHGIEIFRGEGKKEGHVLFRFMTKDGFIPQVDVNMNDLFRDPEGYVENMVADLVNDLENARDQRQDATTIYIPGKVAN